jgi:hypothetical protein
MRTHRSALLLASILSVTVLSTNVVRSSQKPATQETPRPPQVASRETQVYVDGSKNPEKIPDRLVISMLRARMSLPEDRDAKQVWRFRSWAQHEVGLTSGDTEIAMAEATRLFYQLERQKAVMATARETARLDRTPENMQKVRDGFEQVHALTMESYTRLLKTLSPGGSSKLQSHIVRLKAETKIFGAAKP